MTPADVRALFEATRTYTWLNAAASSPLSAPVRAALDGFTAEGASQGDLAFPKWLAFREGVRARVAALVGARPGEVAFTPSTSFGFHVAAELLKGRGVTEVLSLDGEFPSTTVPFLARGLTVRGVRRRPDGSVRVEDLAAALRPTTGAVVLSVVQFSSGFRVDLEGVARLCRERKLVLGLNAAQALGQVPVDLAALGASFLAAPSHKWLYGGYGTGLLVVRGDWLETQPLPLAGWLSVEPDQLWKTFPSADRTDDATGFVVRGAKVRKEASALELGATSFGGMYALDAALSVLEQVGVPATLVHNQRLQGLLRGALRRRGFIPNAPDDAASLSGICGVPVEGSPEDVVKALIKEHAVVTTARAGVLRLSTHVYNDEGDVERLLSAMERLGVRPAVG